MDGFVLIGLLVCDDLIGKLLVGYVGEFCEVGCWF